MTVAVALLVGAAVVASVAPRVLHAAAARSLDPVAVIVGWYLAMAGVAGTTAGGLLLAAVPHRAADAPLARLVGRAWWSAVAAGPELPAYRIAGWAAPSVLVVAVLGVVVAAVRHGRRSRRRGAGIARLRMVARTERGATGGPPTWWLPTDRPAAFSVGGRDAAVVVTDGVRARLSGPAVAAVLAHEREHVRGRHHAVVAVAEVLAAALPMLPVCARAPAALREQVELAADLAAVRRCGPDAVRDALIALTGACTPEGALAMARDAADVRLRRLAVAADPPTARSRARSRVLRSRVLRSRVLRSRVLWSGPLGAAVALGPLVAAGAVLLALSGLAVIATALA